VIFSVDAVSSLVLSGTLRSVSSGVLYAGISATLYWERSDAELAFGFENSSRGFEDINQTLKARCTMNAQINLTMISGMEQR
jgi:hypothetical protein